MRFDRPEMFRGRRGGMIEGAGRMFPRVLHSGPWTLMVRHRAGSLDTLVQHARWRNLAVSGGVLALLLAAVGAMVRASRRAQKTAELQMNFVAGVSHELRTPLTVLRTAGFNLRSGVSRKPEQVEQYGKLVQEESEKLGRLVEQILRFAASDAGSLVRTLEPVDVAPIIESSLKAIEIVLDYPDITIERHIDPDLPPVLADSLALKHAVQNLIDNAMKYSAPQEAWIGLSACAVRDSRPPAVEISVSDHGPGIPEEELNSVFDPFFRGRDAVQAQIHGAGLGLNLVKKIAEAHGGSVGVTSVVGKGSTFTLRIPAAAEPQESN
jgi:signal transduction histidine kinase